LDIPRYNLSNVDNRSFHEKASSRVRSEFNMNL
jgi:hypothetical protein